MFTADVFGQCNNFRAAELADFIPTTIQAKSMSSDSSMSDTALLRTQMQYLAEAGTSAYVFGLFAVAFACLTLWKNFPPQYVLCWGSITALVTLVRYLHFLTFNDKKSDQEMLLFHRLFSFGTMAAALCWGALGLSVYYITDPFQQALVVIVALSISGGSVIVTAGLIHLTRAFVLVTSIPLVLALISMGEAYFPIGILALGIFVLLNFLAKAIHESVVESYNAHVENQQLIAELKESKKNAEAINRQLKTEIAVRNKAEVHMVEARDKAEQAARAKSDFLATMSHEIRTPMNGVLGMTELLMNTNLSAKQFRFADTIRRSGEALLAIINDILDFSKIDAGKLEIQHTVFDLRQLVEDTASFFAESAQSKKIELVANFPPEEHNAYRGDPDRIRQILTNLIGNALKFTERGEITVLVNTIDTSTETSTVKFAVADTGIGIAEEHQAHIFDFFQQADGSTTRKFGGTGLGLAICNRLVKLMHGEIGVESRPGSGSTFWFTVQLTPASATAVSTPIKGDMSFAGLKALIVDDSETNQEVLEHQLADWEIQTDTVSSGTAALKYIKRAIDNDLLYDVVILDRQMPEIDGIELAQRIRKNKHTRSVAIVMLSSINQLEETGRWYSAGVDVYVNKPVRQAELYESLCLALEEKNKGISRAKPSQEKDKVSEQHQLNADVLVAEDNPINQELVRTMLENMGCKVVIVDNGLEAVEAITDAPLDQMQKRYDLVLMDCQMPELDGFQATEKIRAWEMNETRKIPIIALTANAMSGDREKCLNAGMDDYLTKPFGEQELFDVCQKWISLEVKTKPAIAAEKSAQSADPAAPSNSQRAELDAKTLANIRALQREGGPDILAKVINLYLKNAPPMLEKLQEAATTGNSELLRGTAHSLKSSSANLGALKLAELCAELESMGKNKELANTVSTLGLLEFEFEAVCNALQFELQEAAA